MIAVLAKDTERPVVKEFFELFKTPWEFYQSHRDYDVLIASGNQKPNSSARLVLIFGSEETTFDREHGTQILSRRSNRVLYSSQIGRIPIYGKCLSFGARSREPRLRDENSNEAATLEITSPGQALVRIGYDLFEEIGHLLTRGQPPTHSRIPVLELHIALLRDLITAYWITLVEIPPVPAGYAFIACLTHDVDHVGVRNHRCDHTMFGFLYRATVGSVIHFLKGRKSGRQLATNWQAALSLPFVHLRLAQDFWYQFENYLRLERGMTSTFFVIPRKGDAGHDANGCCPSKRAARYDVTELVDHIRKLQSGGHEIGVHGIDAWRDKVRGREEFERISGLTGKSELGVRMHWLLFDTHSAAILEDAGFTYDSTVGYNDTVGYRAGTTQAFKPLGVERILELPLHIMDTAMFYPSYMNLSTGEAEAVVRALVQNATRYGGVLTVNWHDRSIAPERLWGDIYVRVLDDLKREGAWFSTAAQAVSWFRKRRSASIEGIMDENGVFKIKASVAPDKSSPGLRIRVHKSNDHANRLARNRYVDFAFNDTEISIEV